MIEQSIEAPLNLLLLAGTSRPAEPALTTWAPEPVESHRVGLIGRERELALLKAMVGHAPEAGSALLIRGVPGTGKTALVGALVEDVRAQSIAILRASGIPAEAKLPYAGLHQLLRPLRGHLSSLPRPQRRAIEAVFGITPARPPEPMLVAIATLDLLSMAARPSLVVVVDDAQWLDRPTSVVLSFVARRLWSDPIVLLVTARDDQRSPILDAGLTELRLGRLSDDEAAHLLATVRPDMAESVKERLIQVAAGNALALLELQATLTSDQLLGQVPLHEPSQLTARLRHAICARTRELPVVTRRLLRLLALDDGGDVAHLLSAYQALYPGEPATLDALLPAVDAGTVVLREGTATFRHQLVRTAVREATSASERRSAQVALAGARLARASHQNEAPRHSLDTVARTDDLVTLGAPLDAASANIAYPSMTPDHIDLDAGTAVLDGDPPATREALWLTAQDILWESGDRDARLAARQLAAQIDSQPHDPWLLAISAALGSADTAVVSEAACRYEGLDVPASDLLLVGMSAAIAGDIPRSRLLLARAAPAFRGEGDRPRLAQLLAMQAWNDVVLGRWTDAASEIAEATELARDAGLERWSQLADVAGAMLGAMQGDEGSLERHLTRVGPAALTGGWIATTIEVVRGLNDLGAGRAEAACARLRGLLAISEPDAGLWAIDQFADAAVLAGNVDDGRAVLAACLDVPDARRGPLQTAALAYAGAVLADDAMADERLTVADEDLAPWPIHQARLRLHRGSWLRRHRRVAESREPLRAARDLFEALGATRLAERARRELRASGERSRRRDVTAWDQLSPQETEIAQMAAQGLSNREIGEQLFLSHRTVGAHLYRIFPKLGVTSRGQLHTVLAADGSGGAGRAGGMMVASP